MKIILEDSSIVSQGSSGFEVGVSYTSHRVGGIVGLLSGEARVNECIIGETVEIAGGNSTCAGGIAGTVVGNISRCINSSVVKKLELMKARLEELLDFARVR